MEQGEERIIRTGNGRILVMDDEESVREIAGDILNHLGYEVEFARDGAEALELYRKAGENGVPFNAVLVDLTIPGRMGGKENRIESRMVKMLVYHEKSGIIKARGN